MKREIKITIFLLTFSLALKSQINLIPNSSFETLTGCPINSNQINVANGWSTPHGSPDLFASCSTNSQVSTPENFVGYQCPSNGSNYAGYAGIFGNTFQNAYHEILGIKLSDSLLIGTTYYFSFKLSLADAIGQYADACSHNGFKLTRKPLPNLGFGTTTPTNVVINNFAHFYTNQIITDTLNWTTLKGSITADSNYKYIYFGVFFQQSIITLVNLYGVSTYSTPYYLIDDVCLSTDSNTCKINSQNCITTNIGSFQFANSCNLIPNPSSNYFTITGIKPKSISLFQIRLDKS